VNGDGDRLITFCDQGRGATSVVEDRAVAQRRPAGAGGGAFRSDASVISDLT